MSKFITTLSDTRLNEMYEVGYWMPTLEAARRQLKHLKEAQPPVSYVQQFDIQEFDDEDNYIQTYYDE